MAKDRKVVARKGRLYGWTVGYVRRHQAGEIDVLSHHFLTDKEVIATAWLLVDDPDVRAWSILERPDEG